MLPIQVKVDVLSHHIFIQPLFKDFLLSLVQLCLISLPFVFSFTLSLQDAIKRLKPLNPVSLTVSSRTDTGVHALSNSAHFDLLRKNDKPPFSEDILVEALNFHLRSEQIRWVRTPQVSALNDICDLWRSVVVFMLLIVSFQNILTIESGYTGGTLISHNNYVLFKCTVFSNIRSDVGNCLSATHKDKTVMVSAYNDIVYPPYLIPWSRPSIHKTDFVRSLSLCEQTLHCRLQNLKKHCV